MNSAEARNGNMQLIEIRKVNSDFASLNDYQIFRDELMSKCIHPWLKQAHQRTKASNIPHAIWGLATCEMIVGVMINSALLAYEELDYSINLEIASQPESVTSFSEWVAQFNPASWGDWLMVPKLYQMHLRTGKELPTLIATPDPWIDAVLRESRGIMMWSYQFIQITRMIANVSIAQANQMRLDWVLKEHKIRETIGNIHYPPTYQTQLQILEERMVGMEYLGSPDYFFADWLSKHYINHTSERKTNVIKMIN